MRAAAAAGALALAAAPAVHSFTPPGTASLSSSHALLKTSSSSRRTVARMVVGKPKAAASKPFQLPDFGQMFGEQAKSCARA